MRLAAGPRRQASDSAAHLISIGSAYPSRGRAIVIKRADLDRDHLPKALFELLDSQVERLRRGIEGSAWPARPPLRRDLLGKPLRLGRIPGPARPAMRRYLREIIEDRFERPPSNRYGISSSTPGNSKPFSSVSAISAASLRTIPISAHAARRARATSRSCSTTAGTRRVRMIVAFGNFTSER